MDFRYENKKIKEGYDCVIGCDEVGRGCLAGPAAAAAVALDLSCKTRDLREVRDSKLLSPAKREKLSVIIKDNCLAWGIGLVDEKTIDKINIHRATLAAMKMAVENLLASLRGTIPEFFTKRVPLLSEKYPGSINKQISGSRLGGRDDTAKILLAIDGKFIIPDFNIEQEAIVGGDNKILSIATASIVAKVYRDNLMRKLHQQYPVYNFEQHKGYGTLFHRTMILQNGLSPIHRKSFCGHITV